MADPVQPETTAGNKAFRELATRMAQENDVNVRDAENALRRMLAHGLIELRECGSDAQT